MEAYRQFKTHAYDEIIQRYLDTGKITSDMKPTKANGAKFGFNSSKVLQVLAGTWLDEVKGPKTPNFFDNLFGRGKEATIDLWAARTMRRMGYDKVKGAPEQWRIQPASEAGVTNLDFAFSQQAMRHAATRLKMDPHELQAILWYAEKHHWAEQGWAKGGAAEAKASYVPMLKSLAGRTWPQGSAQRVPLHRRKQSQDDRRRTLDQLTFNSPRPPISIYFSSRSI
jgi:hypothetical protein